MTTATALSRRTDTGLPGRFARSAAVTSGALTATADVPGWLDEHVRAHPFRVKRIPFAALDGWSFQPETGNLAHRSGRFFTVEGLHVTLDEGGVTEWEQPIIVQPEVGILGILAAEVDGVLHFLLQAKMEPGNPNIIQLSPTVQATRSNYTKVHRGADVPYLEYFIEPGRGRILADVLQSEHGSWFFRKVNRNMIVEVDHQVPLRDGFCWLTLGQIGALLGRDNTVNMDARSVLACAPAQWSEPGALHSDTELLSWFTAQRSRHSLRARRVSLAGISHWVGDDVSIRHAADRYFRVVAVAVEAGSREVPSWTQPMFEPVGRGIIAFVVREFAGVPHVLAQARVEGGFLDTVELAPTVQVTPENEAHLPAAARSPFLDLVLGAGPGQIRYDAVHAEEGGRFLAAESRCLVVEADAPADPPPGYLWVTPGQLSLLARHGHYVNVQARTLLSVLNCRPECL